MFFKKNKKEELIKKLSSCLNALYNPSFKSSYLVFKKVVRDFEESNVNINKNLLNDAEQLINDINSYAVHSNPEHINFLIEMLSKVLKGGSITEQERNDAKKYINNSIFLKNIGDLTKKIDEKRRRLDYINENIQDLKKEQEAVAGKDKSQWIQLYNQIKKYDPELKVLSSEIRTLEINIDAEQKKIELNTQSIANHQRVQIFADMKEFATEVDEENEKINVEDLLPNAEYITDVSNKTNELSNKIDEIVSKTLTSAMDFRDDEAEFAYQRALEETYSNQEKKENKKEEVIND